MTHYKLLISACRPGWDFHQLFASIFSLVGYGRLNGQNDRPLSRVEKEVLLKLVAQAIPTYVASCFLLPIGVCENIRRSISNFQWGIEDGRRKLHWISRKWLSSPKFLGGMGISDISIFNQVMLGKQCWRLLIKANYLCARVLYGRYYPDGDFMTAMLEVFILHMSQSDVWDATNAKGPPLESRRWKKLRNQ